MNNNPFESIALQLRNIESLLLDIKHQAPQQGNTCDVWYDINQLCQILPDKPAKATVYGWVHEGTIPYHKSKKKLRFLKSEIDAWLKTGSKKTAAQIEEEAKDILIKGRR